MVCRGAGVGAGEVNQVLCGADAKELTQGRYARSPVALV